MFFGRAAAATSTRDTTVYNTVAHRVVVTLEVAEELRHSGRKICRTYRYLFVSVQLQTILDR